MESKQESNVSWASGFNLFFTSLPVSCLALFDKDVTYEEVMSHEEQARFYQSREYVGHSEDGSYLPTPCLRIMPLIKQNFHFLYHSTQLGWDFSWKRFFMEILNAVCLAVILCLVTFGVCSGLNIQHIEGYTYDFWMSSFTIYASLIYISNCSLVIRAGQITWFFLFWVFFASIIPFLVVSLLFDTVMSLENGSQYLLLNMGSTYNYYLVCIANVFIAFMFEAGRKCIQVFFKPRLSDYFRSLIAKGEEGDPSKFDRAIINGFIESHLKAPSRQKSYNIIPTNESVAMRSLPRRRSQVIENNPLYPSPHIIPENVIEENHDPSRSHHSDHSIIQRNPDVNQNERRESQEGLINDHPMQNSKLLTPNRPVGRLPPITSPVDLP